MSIVNLGKLIRSNSDEELLSSPRLIKNSLERMVSESRELAEDLQSEISKLKEEFRENINQKKSTDNL